MSLKHLLYKQCNLYVEKREQTVITIISSAQKALTSETKSSAGDKHETGRAMLQLEMEKAGQQLQGINQMKETLAKINIEKSSEIAHLGSIVSTNKISYYLSISAGQLTIESNTYFAISISSPIGRLLLGKKVGDSFTFNNNEMLITSVN